MEIAPDFQGDIAQLQQRFAGTLERAARLTRGARVVIAALAAVGLAYIASRFDAPVGVGLCGLLVVAPLVWLATGLLVPLAAVRGGTGSGHIAIQSGAPVTFDAAGVSAGGRLLPWATVRWVGESSGAIAVRGFDPRARVAFELIVFLGVSGAEADRTALVSAIRRQLTP